MGSNEKFCLRWNDFESNISVAFREIREEKDFFDCTLSCGSRQIQAHKLILSACSPFFRTVLKQNSHQHPLLYLKGVEFSDLQAVLNFMYHGEVNVAQEELNSFLSVAEDLQVKGLTQNNSSSNSNPKPEMPPPTPTPPSIQKPRPSFRELETNPNTKRPRPTPPTPRQEIYQHPTESDDIQEISMPVVKTEPEPVIHPVGHGTEGVVDNLGMEVANMEESYEEGYEDYGGYDSHGYEVGDGQGYAGQQYGGNGAVAQQQQDLGQDASLGINDNIIDDPLGQGFTCALCGKGFGVNKHHCRRHIKNFHRKPDISLSCNVCQKSYKNYDSLRHHQRTSHGLYKQ